MPTELFILCNFLDIIIGQSDAHNFDAALNTNSLQPVGPRSVEAFQRTDVDSTDYDLLLLKPRSVQRSQNCADVAHAHTSLPDAHAAVVSARRRLKRLRFMASSRSEVPVELSTRSPSRYCADRSMWNSLIQIQRQPRSSRHPTPNLQL